MTVKKIEKCKMSLAKMEILEEVELLAEGLSGDEYVKINAKNILYGRIDVWRGGSVKIRVEDLRAYFEGD